MNKTFYLEKQNDKEIYIYKRKFDVEADIVFDHIRNNNEIYRFELCILECLAKAHGFNVKILDRKS